MSYKVYTVEFLNLIGRGNHIAIFIETTPSSNVGQLHHVLGTILMGMKYERLTSYDIAKSASFIEGSNVLIGDLQQTDLERFEAICEATPPPGVQMTKNGNRIDPSAPLRRCGEWVKELLDDAKAQGVVR